MNPSKRRALGFVLQMPMEGDSSGSYSPPPVMISPGGREAEAVYAPPPGVSPSASYMSPEQRWADQASADAIRLAQIKIPTATGGPEGLQLIPDISGGWTGTGGREGDRSYTQQQLTGYRNYNPSTRILHGWDTSGNYLGSQYIPKDDPWSGIKELATNFILPAIGMYTGINALGGLFGAAPAVAAPAASSGNLAALTAGSAPGAVEAATAAIPTASAGNLAALTAGSAPGAAEAAAAITSPLDLLAAEAIPSVVPAAVTSENLAALTAGSAPGAAEAAAAVTSPLDLLAAEAIPAATTSGNLAALTAGSAPGAAEAATAMTSPLDLLAAGAGETGSVPMAIGNEAVASGMSPGSLGAKAAAENVLLDSQLAAMYGTPAVSALTGGTTAAANLLKSPNEAVASGMSPGSVGAAQGAAGMLTDAQLAAAYGTPAAASTSLPKLSLPASSATPSQSSGLSFVDPAALAGYYKTVGQMGSDASQQKLQQLYSDMAAPAAVASPYSYVEDVAPESVDFTKMMNLPFQYPGYAEGGTVETSNAALMKSLKELGALGSETKAPQHNVREIRQMGTSVYSPKILPQLAALLQSRGMRLADGGQPDDHTHPNYDGTPVFRTGGLSGLGGKYVQGKGDGTSDDISAMLADGEYVFSADVVSALGNGSNKAGADKLSEMVHAIRSRARSATPDKLPPDAKSPLEYLKSSKGKKNG